MSPARDATVSTISTSSSAAGALTSDASCTRWPGPRAGSTWTLALSSTSSGMAARISWSIYWANSKDGTLGSAMIGQFTNGRGEFYDQELFQGRAIYVRFIFSDITPTSFRLEQAFSADGGTTWQPNWIAAFTRQKP